MVILVILTHKVLSFIGFEKMWHSIVFYIICSIAFLIIYVKNKGNGGQAPGGNAGGYEIEDA